MRIFTKIFLILLSAVFIFTAPFFSDPARASFWSAIRAWVAINPLEAKVSAPAEVEIGKVFKIEARALNKGGEKIENAVGEIILPDGLILIQKDPVKEIGAIPGKREKKVSWSAKGEATGKYFVSVLISGELAGQAINAEDTAGPVEIIKESARKTGPRDWLRNLFGFFRKSF